MNKDFNAAVSQNADGSISFHVGSAFGSGFKFFVGKTNSGSWYPLILSSAQVLRELVRNQSPLHRLLSLIAAHSSPSQLSRPHWDFDNQNNNYRSLQLMTAYGGGI